MNRKLQLIRPDPRWLRWFVVLGVCGSLAHCAAYKDMTRPRRGNPAMHQIAAEIKQGVEANRQIEQRNTQADQRLSQALLPALEVAQPEAKEKAPVFDVAVKDVPVGQFFLGLVKGTQHNIVVSPKLTGSISLDLKQVTLEEAMEAVHDVYGYEYRKTSYGYQVFPAGLQTRIFTINYLAMSRSGESFTSISSGQITQKITGTNSDSTSTTSSGTSTTSSSNESISPSSKVETKTNSNFWSTLKVTLDSIVGNENGRKIVMNPGAGMVIVRADSRQLKQVGEYLDSLESTMIRQVIIEAKILEVTLNDNFQSGIDWKLLGMSQVTNQTLTGNLKAFTSMFTLSGRGGSNNNDFSAAIKLLSDQGNVQTLSSPRIATLNNQKAVIKVGTDEFFVTNVSSTSVGSGNTTETTQDLDLTPFFSGIALDVTPQIDASGGIILHIHPIVSTVTDQDKSFTVSDKAQVLPLALSTIRESDSVVHAENGQIVVIGGLMENKTKEYQGSTPGLAKAPVVGPLFRRTNQTSVKSELVILLRPVMVTPKTQTKSLSKLGNKMKSLTRGFHYGAHPEIYGNGAEH